MVTVAALVEDSVKDVASLEAVEKSASKTGVPSIVSETEA